MARCLNCNACQSQYDFNDCKFCGYPNAAKMAELRGKKKLERAKQIYAHIEFIALIMIGLMALATLWMAA